MFIKRFSFYSCSTTFIKTPQGHFLCYDIQCRCTHRLLFFSPHLKIYAMVLYDNYELNTSEEKKFGENSGKAAFEKYVTLSMGHRFVTANAKKMIQTKKFGGSRNAKQCVTYFSNAAKQKRQEIEKLQVSNGCSMFQLKS